MKIIHVSLSFASLPNPDLVEFTTEVITGLTGNADFPTPVVSVAELTNGRDTFQADIAAAAAGGQAETAQQDLTRADLLGLLRQEAQYVQTTAANNLTKLLSTGFKATNPNRAQTQLATPVIQAILNEQSGQLVVRVSPVANARAYEARISFQRSSNAS
ncbi:MAG: hypothetical protein RLZZ350_2692 [Verrucomicrobiota bacterium]|jgi:hypothetical protein